MQEEIFIDNIEFCGYEEQQCIEIDNPNGLFIVGKNNEIVTHNSTLTILILLYVACCYALMRNPRRYFSFPDSAVFVLALCAVTQSKASEIYVEPIQQLLESSTFWYQCRSHNEMIKEDKRLQDCETVESIPWRTGGRSSVISSGGGLNWKQISSAGSLLGMQILCGAMTEITFFLEAGKGWALDINTPIIMADNSLKLMKDLQIGDKLAHPHNKENIITNIPYEDIDDEYEITFDNGKTVSCHLNHIWLVSYRKDKNNEKIYELVTTYFMIHHPELEFDIPDIYENQ